MGLLNEKTGFYDMPMYLDEAFLDWTSFEPSNLCLYPIQYLTDSLGGIMKSELVVIGADSGCGKSELANSIAFINAGNKKNVYLFSLEGDRYEVIQRFRYRQYIKSCYSSGRKEMVISYREFIHRRNLPKGIEEEILVIDELFKAKFKTLNIYNREDVLDIKKLEAHLEIIDSKADLVVLDHLHYFDFLSDNEHAEITKIMKSIKRLQDKYRVPIVLVSHLRKKDKGRVFPDKNDFHGSSNIVKQADTAIIIAHPEVVTEEDNEKYQEQIQNNIYKTGIRVAKSRTGFGEKVVGVVDYDLNKRGYEREYKLSIIGDKFIMPMDRSKYPKWAINAVPENYYAKN